MALNVIDMGGKAKPITSLDRMGVAVADWFAQKWVAEHPYSGFAQQRPHVVNIDLVFSLIVGTVKEGEVVSWALHDPSYSYWVVCVPTVSSTHIRNILEAIVHELVHVYLNATHDTILPVTEQEEEYVREAVEAFRQEYP